MVLFVIMKKLETFLSNIEAYKFHRYLPSGTSLFSVQQQYPNTLEVDVPVYRFSIDIMSW
jgi:hypothetical protein